MNYRRLIVLGSLALAIAAAATLVWTEKRVGASRLEKPLTQQGAPLLLNYQGRLADPSTNLPKPDGSYAVTFSLYSSEEGGSPIWLETQTVTVTRGLFNVLLGSSTPLSPSDFDGTGRWLELEVEGETLAPRVRIASVPYAIQAEEAKNADTVDGAHASELGANYDNVLIVAKGGGDYVSIQAALDSITDATSANRYLVWVAPGTYTETVTMKPYVDIEGAGELATKITYPGSGSTSSGTVVGADDAELRFLTVENTGGDASAVAIYNSGVSPRLTHVTAIALDASYESYGVFNDASSPVMMDVTVTSIGPSGGTDLTSSCGVYNTNASAPTMRDVKATASGLINAYGVRNENSSPTMTSVVATAPDGVYNTGVYNDHSSPTMTDVTATASGGSSNNCGVRNYHASPTMTDVTVVVSGTGSTAVFNHGGSPTMTDVTAKVSGGSDMYGVRNYESSPRMTDVRITASGGSNRNYGLYNYRSSATITNLTVAASGGTDNRAVYNNHASPTIQNSVVNGGEGAGSYGIYNWATSGTYTVTVTNCQITGGENTIYNDSEFTTLVGASLLSGGDVMTNGGTVTCAGVHDEGYGFHSSSCP